jgi:hypothetical protein
VKAYLFSANGAMFIVAWGNAPGCRPNEFASAESAIHLHLIFGDLIRAFSAGLRGNFPWGVAPGLHEAAPLALN